MQIEERYIRKADVTTMVGLSANTIARMENAGTFPGRFRLGKNSVAWKLSELTEWMESRRRETPHTKTKAA